MTQQVYEMEENHPEELVRGDVESGYALFLRGWQLLVSSVGSLNIKYKLVKQP